MLKPSISMLIELLISSCDGIRRIPLQGDEGLVVTPGDDVVVSGGTVVNSNGLGVVSMGPVVLSGGAVVVLSVVVDAAKL